MSKKVLLARPHAFIVKEMRPFLEAAGYQPEALANLGDVNRQNLAAYNGAIISMAVVSSIPARAIRQRAVMNERCDCKFCPSHCD